MNLDKFFDRTYNESSYNCAHFVSEVWQYMTGEDISEKLTGFTTSRDKRSVNMKLRFDFERLVTPVTPCLILMHRRRTSTHVGIYINGKILHLTEKGVQRVSIENATYGFNKYGFYR